MFLTESMNKSASETAQHMHEMGITVETPVREVPRGFFIGTIPFRVVEAQDGRRVIPLNRYEIEGKTYYLYQRLN